MRNSSKDAARQSNRRSLPWFVSLIVTMLFLSCPPGWAKDDKTAQSDFQMGDITVTATKMTTEVNNIPTNLTVISREELENRPGHFNPLTLIQEANIPGVFIQSNYLGSGSAIISMSTRGSEVSNWGMRIMVNGVEANRGTGTVAASRVAVHDIERIEITKTPSAEYGDQAIGGVVNIITRTPSEPVEGKAGIAFTSLGGGNGYSVINGTRDKWEYYLDASGQRQDAYQDDGFQDGTNFYTRISYALSTRAQLTFHGSYNDIKGVYTEGLTRKQLDDDPSQNPNTGADYDYDSEDILGALVYEHQLGPHDFMAKMELQTSESDMYCRYVNQTESLLAHPEISMTFNHKVSGMPNKLVVGGEYRYHDYDVMKFTATSLHDLVAVDEDFNRKDIGYAGYLQDELLVTDALTLTAGIRYDYFDLEQNANIALSDAWAQDKGAFSPKVGLTYQLCDEVNLFAGYNSGIKSPVKLKLYWTNGELDPEKLQAWEAGIRGNIAGWLNYNMAFFWQTVKDKFVKPSVDWESLYENAGETSSKGVELGAGAKLPHNFYASASFTYQESEFEEFVSMGVDYSGNKLTGVPDAIFALTLGYRNGMMGDISLNPVYTGKRYFNYANTNEEDGFWVLNARWSKKFGRVGVYLWANNLLDESAVGSGSGNPGMETLYPISGFNTMLGMNVDF